MTQARLTELEATNAILRLLARMPVNSLNAADLTPDATFALQELRYENKAVQAVGWHFNREQSVKLVPTANKVPLTDDIARVDNAKRWGGWGGRGGMDLTMRVDPVDGVMKLYDRTANLRNTDPFDFSNVSEVRVDLVRYLDFEGTPDSFRQYVTIRAGRAVQSRLIADPTQYRFSLDDEAAALRLLAKEETDTSDANGLRAPGVWGIVARLSPLDYLESR